jgi:ribonucleoside-diphosphate reductase alpha subunit
MYYIMRVTKRSGRVEDVKFDNVTNRISKLTECLSNSVDVTKVAQQVFSSIYDGINTHEIDTLSAEICIGMITSDPDYEILATRITASNIQKRAANNFHIAMRKLHKAGIVTHEVLEVSSKVKDDIKPERDYDFGYFGLKTLEKGYLQKIDGEIIETPQYMYMRVAIGIHGHDTERVLETYDALSKGLFIHATPTLFNAGTPRPQMSSCFVAGTAVFTTNRGPVPIEEVCIGDNVVTHTGSIKPVLQTHKNLLGDRTLFDVKIYKTPGFQVTGNHRFWSITKEQLHWKDEPQWNSIEHLRVGDWISIPKTKLNTVYEILDMYELLKDENGTEHWTYSFEFDGTKMRRLTHFTSEYRPNGITLKGEWFERYIKVDEDFAWFIGSWYGDGCITYQRSSAKSKRTPTHRGISFAQNPNNTTFIEKIEKIGCKYLGVHACISKSKKRNCLSISFNNSAIGNAFNILFGRWSSGKFLWPNMYSWNRNMVSAFIGGLVSTDGCCTLRGNVTVQLTNQPLIKSIFHLSRSVGLDTSLTVGSKPYKDRKQYIGRIQFPWIPEIMKWVYKHYDDNRLYKSERANTTLEIDGKIFLRINAKTRVKDNLPEFVYTLGVKDDHSYTVQGVIAENCFLIANKEDSIDGIYDTVKECARISKWAGGIGLHIHDVRANKSHIRGTNGTSDGIIPMLRVYNSTARYVNQAGRRKGSIAVYLEPWHADILDFLEIRLNQGDEEARCRDLFSAMWIPDLFMKRVESGGNWSLFCPDQAKGLSDVYGKEFEDLYEKYEAEGLARKVVPASEVWKAIIKSQSETGTPYMLYKDACNEKSNHKHVGTIKSSNLCTEILEYTDKDETAVCNLASIALPKYVDVEKKEFNHEELHRVTKMVTRNLNKVIDKNFYPTENGERSNMRHRPIGIGVQGLADVFIMLRMSFGSEESRKLNRDIFETIYHASLESSCELAEMYGTYETFKGSPFSQGILQFDMWDRDPKFSGRYDWNAMRELVKKGTRNSLLLAPMPTASTSQILGNNECFEPYTTNIYLRRTLAGEFVVVNKHLVNDLKERGLWSKEMKDLMVKANGSVQNIIDIPDDLKELYKTVWEMSQKTIIDMAADRGVYIDQSQSMNLFVESPTLSKLSSMHMYAWKTGLKTGMYYLRSKAKARPIQFSLEAECAMCSA